jgi:hypothetical protein
LETKLLPKTVKEKAGNGGERQPSASFRIALAHVRSKMDWDKVVSVSGRKRLQYTLCHERTLYLWLLRMAVLTRSIDGWL